MVRLGRLVSILMLVMSTSLLPIAANASTILFRTDAQLITQSDRVVHGRVVAQRAVRPQFPGGRIYTVTTLAVIEDLTGVAGDTIEIWELGGRIGDAILFIGGAVEYRLGQEVLVCLERGPLGYRSVAMAFSKFDVTTAGTGAATLRRDVGETSIVGGVVSSEVKTLDEFRALAANVLGRPSRKSQAGAAAQVAVAEPWTNLGPSPGMRWRDADLGVPIRVYKNSSAPPPLFSGDGVAEIETALAAWTNPASGSIALHYAGTTFESLPDTGWTTIPEHSTLITFEDPYDELGGAVLAIGGGTPSGFGTGGTVNGITYYGFTSGFIIFQNAVDLPASFRQSLNFLRVVTHEIGHTIGFNHTQTDGSVMDPASNIMYPSCCLVATPTPPALGADDLVGLAALYPQAPLSGPTMALDRTLVRFGAVTSGGALATQTTTQAVRLTQSGAGTVSWTASATRPWLRVTPASGTGPATLSISIASDATLPASGSADAAVVFTFNGASNAPGPIAVRLALYAHGSTSGPFGTVDTPVDHTANITGAVPFTGWTLDDVEVESVFVCRAPSAGESAVADPRCGGALQLFVGSGVFIDGARPDVQSSYPTYPLNARAGWGFMVLTNMLPGGGNGTYQFSVYARDRENRMALLGTRTITCDNAHATKPFGTIDTPTQGGSASGASYLNFGWALTPQPKIIPLDGSSITVLVDGVARGTVSYNHERADIESLFPGYQNTIGTNGAVGFRVLDTTALSNGLHTISWVVTDNAGVSEGIGSRFFTVSNGSSSPIETSAPAVDARMTREAIDATPIDRRPIAARRGWDTGLPWRSVSPGAAGRVVIRSEEVDRIDLAFERSASDGYTAYLRTGSGLEPLPAGSHFDPLSGRFTWTLVAGFVGNYDLVFVRSSGASIRDRREVRIVLHPKTSGLVGPQIVIDAPRPQQQVVQPFMLGGWAADLSAPGEDETGVSGLHVWAYPAAGGPPIFVGAAAYGGARADVAAVHGERFGQSGFGLIVDGLVPGTYDLAVFAWSTEKADFLPARVVRATIR